MVRVKINTAQLLKNPPTREVVLTGTHSEDRCLWKGLCHWRGVHYAVVQSFGSLAITADWSGVVDEEATLSSLGRCFASTVFFFPAFFLRGNGGDFPSFCQHELLKIASGKIILAELIPSTYILK